MRAIVAPAPHDRKHRRLIDADATDGLRALRDASRQGPHNGRRDRLDGYVEAHLHRPV
jgi:hypothetical protein